MRFAVFFVLFFLFACGERPTHGYQLQSHNPGNGARNVYRTYYQAAHCEEARASRVYWASETEWRCVRVEL